MAAFALLWLLGAIVVPLSTGGAVPPPTAPATDVAAHLADAGGATATSVALLLAGAALLIAGAAVLHSRLVFLAPGAPGPYLAGAGGAAAGVLLATDAAALYATSLPAVQAQPAVVAGLHGVDFIAGGAAHLATLGVMMLGLAVTTLYLARTPRWLSIASIVLASLDALAIVTVALDELTPVLPVLRLGTIACLVAITSLLPATGPAATTPVAAAPQRPNTRLVGADPRRRSAPPHKDPSSPARPGRKDAAGRGHPPTLDPAPTRKCVVSPPTSHGLAFHVA